MIELSKHTNRTDPVFQGMSMTNSINLGLTTRCTMNCPNCNTAIPKWKEMGTAKHANIEDIYRDSKHLRPLHLLRLTGGEPTMHPQFETIAGLARGWFDCKYLCIETNGSYYRRYRDVFKRFFDRVFITHYLKDSVYEGSPDNSEVIELAKRDLGNRLIVEPPVIHQRRHVAEEEHEIFVVLGIAGKDEPCTKWHKPGLPAGWMHGLLYPCCVTFGIDASVGIPVTENWRQEIQNVPMLCHRCCFQGT